MSNSTSPSDTEEYEALEDASFGELICVMPTCHSKITAPVAKFKLCFCFQTKSAEYSFFAEHNTAVKCTI